MLVATVFGCYQGYGKASFYDVYDPAQNHGWVGQVKCGGALPEDGLFAAVSSTCFDTNMDICGTMVDVMYNGKRITLPILDACVGCPENQIDLSAKAFGELEPDYSVGILQGLSWEPVGGETEEVAPMELALPLVEDLSMDKNDPIVQSVMSGDGNAVLEALGVPSDPSVETSAQPDKKPRKCIFTKY